jgi:hypothetical protein
LSIALRLAGLQSLSVTRFGELPPPYLVLPDEKEQEKKEVQEAW